MTFRFLILSLLALGLCVPTSFAGSRSAKPEKTGRSAKEQKIETKEMELLGKSTEIYWQAMRWQNVVDASNFIENPALRLQYQQWLTSHFAVSRTAEVSVMRVEVGPPVKLESNVMRKAIVTANVQGYAMPEQILKTDVVQQIWYRSTSGWWLEWSPPEPAAPATPPPVSTEPEQTEQPQDQPGNSSRK